MISEPERSGGVLSMKAAVKAMANGSRGPGGSERVVEGLHQPVAVLLHLLEELPGELVAGVEEAVPLLGPQVALRLRLLLEELLLPHLPGQVRVALPVLE